MGGSSTVQYCQVMTGKHDTMWYLAYLDSKLMVEEPRTITRLPKYAVGVM